MESIQSTAEKTVAVNQDAVTEKQLSSPILITEIVPNTDNVAVQMPTNTLKFIMRENRL